MAPMQYRSTDGHRHMGELPTAPGFSVEEARYRSFEVTDGTMVIYDPENPEAWIRSDSFAERPG
jgi:hypothetical protein